MGQHRAQHVVLPAGILPHFIVRHPAFRLPFLKTWFNRPPQATEPEQRAKRDTGWRLAERVGIGRRGAAGPFEHQPDGALREPSLTERHAVTRKIVRNRPLGPCRDFPPIPLPGRQRGGQRRDTLRGAGRRTPGAFCPFFAFLPIALLLGARPLEPAARLRRDSHQSRRPPTGIHRRQNIRAIAVHAIGHDIPERP